MTKKSSVPAGESRRRPAPLAVSGWPLRRKLALVLTVPMILAAVFGGLRVTDAVRDLQEYESTQAQLSVLHPFVDYFDAVEEAAVVVHRTPEGSPQRAAAIAAVRESADALETSRAAAGTDRELERTLDRTVGGSVSLQEEAGYADVTALLAQLRMLYAGVQEYVDLVVSDQLVPEPHLPQLAFAVGGRLAFTVQMIQVDRLGGDQNDAFDVYGDIGMEQAALEQLFRIRGAEDIVLGLLQSNQARKEQAMAGQVRMPFEDTFALYDELIGGVLDDTEQTLAQWQSDAQRDALVSAGVTAAALLLATLLALFVARLLVVPVQRVRDGALAVAHEKLPAAVARIRSGEDPGEIEPIDVTTNEEMGQLARAVEDMHRAAIRLAAGEARMKAQVGEMFVTLSRRNTSLVNQQLHLIEALERDEENPDRLESLFRLDHLASRMRRTAESLVILADAPVQQREHAPLAVSEVIQAAAGGVQQYERVQVMGFPTEQIAGSAASDLVHLLTELIDNALSFSPPNTPVEVTTTTSSTETVIRVSDSGLGMHQHQLDSLNDMLRSGGEATPDTARRMGLFVVSRLAHRHGITVRLASNSRGGIVASVSVPPELLAAPPSSLVPDRAPVVEQPAVPAIGAADVRRSAPVDAAEPRVEPQVDPIVAAINAVTGLPQRRPGGTRQERVEALVPGPALTLPDSQPLQDPLDTIDHGQAPEQPGDSPIFASLQSSWLGNGNHWGPAEADAGWRAAEAAVEQPVQERSSSGLPQRRPGRRLVPGTASSVPAAAQPEAVVPARDPEVVRARLAAHAAGVNRGRSLSVHRTPNHEEAGPA